MDSRADCPDMDIIIMENTVMGGMVTDDTAMADTGMAMENRAGNGS